MTKHPVDPAMRAARGERRDRLRMAAAALILAIVLPGREQTPSIAATGDDGAADRSRSATPSWIEQRRATLPEPEAPSAAEARFELAEEIAALQDDSTVVELQAGELRILRALLAEAIELDPAWTSPALRLAAHAESDPERRRRLERMRRAISEAAAFEAHPRRDRLEESRVLALYRGGRIEAAADAADRGDLDGLLDNPWLDQAIDGGAERIRRDLETGTIPLLRPEERRRLLEFDRARLSPDSLRFSDSAWLDGWAPLPEVDADAIAAWLRSMGR